MADTPEPELRPVPLAEGLGSWVRVAILSFGGPAGQISVMHEIVVEEKKWVSEERFLHAMSYCMLLPGPEAQQLATYLGWLLHGGLGGLVAGTLFIIPGFVSLFVLSVLYAEFRDISVVAGLFYGLKPAVMAVVLAALLRIGSRALTSTGAKATAVAAFVAIFFFAVPFPAIVAGAAVLGAWLGRSASVDGVVSRGPAPSLASSLSTASMWLAIWLLPFALLGLPAFDGTVLREEAIFFSKAALVTFGGAYAVLSYVAQQAVEVHHWLLPGEMLDGLGMAETTPGPLVQVVQFVGFMGSYRNPGAFSPLVAGSLGALVTAWATFVPCFLFVLVGAPYAEHLRGRPALRAALSGITAAVVGVILNLAVWFSINTLFGTVTERWLGPLRVYEPDWATLDTPALVLAVGAAVALLRFKVPMMWTLAAGATAGIAWTLATA